MKLPLSLAAACLGLTMIAAPASALPVDRSLGAKDQAPLVDVRYGCRRGYTPNRRGYCVPLRRWDRRTAPYYRENMMHRREGCQWVRTPGGRKYRCK